MTNQERTEDSIRLWRCSACGKWSHAQRNPKMHERRVADSDDFDAAAVTRIEPGGREPETGAWLDLVFVRCGPFDEFAAVRSVGTTP